MRKITTSLILAFGIFTFTAPVSAAPVFTPIAPQASTDVIDVQHRNEWRRKHNRRPNYRNNHRGGQWNGHRGHRNKRPGYRRHSDGMWYPLAAFGLGAIIGGVIANQPAPPPPYRSYGNAHVEWCYGQYRSYRASDDTFQPYNGPRQRCNSPYR